ncbi:MAG: hypothetical protein LUQ01_05950 [Methanolinea sp.]|nr:hypothetical protein [Methanolinea sp.]
MTAIFKSFHEYSLIRTMIRSILTQMAAGAWKAGEVRRVPLPVAGFLVTTILSFVALAGISWPGGMVAGADKPARKPRISGSSQTRGSSSTIRS